MLIGDSVAFGVGVNSDDIFSSLVQKAIAPNRITLLNTAVVGYSLDNYYDIIKDIGSINGNVKRVLLIYTLNDVYDNLI